MDVLYYRKQPSNNICNHISHLLQTGVAVCSTSSLLLLRFLQVSTGAEPALCCSSGSYRFPRAAELARCCSSGSCRFPHRIFCSVYEFLFSFLNVFLKVCGDFYYLNSMKDGYYLKLFQQKTLILIFFPNATECTGAYMNCGFMFLNPASVCFHSFRGKYVNFKYLQEHQVFSHFLLY